MKMIKHVAVTAMMAFVSTTAFAADSSYTPGSVWVSSRIKVEPGQFENYMDYLGKGWRQSQEFGKKEGHVISYHVLSINNARADEPDLILVVQYKDYLKTAEAEAMQKKFEAMIAKDARQQDTASGERKSMRTLMGSTEMQELKLK
jgi:hypothetical protein